MQHESKLLQRPLYIFDLPEELTYTLQLKLQSSIVPTDTVPEQTDSSSSERQDGTVVSATACSLCNLAFSSLQDQRSHVRSDLHGYNLKQKLRGKKTVSEVDFERLVADLDESISGSESSGSSDSEDAGGSKHKDSALSALLKKQAKINDGEAEDAPTTERTRGAGKPPLIWFSSPRLPDNTNLGVYRALFSLTQQGNEEGLVHTIQQKQLAAKPAPSQEKAKRDTQEGGVPLPNSMLQTGTSGSGPHYFLCMIGGGHFAAMVVSLTPKLTKKAGVEDRSATVIAHKTFHRYTTRRKQGGSQSANDNSKGNAHSAGSSLRRYNEGALVEEVRALLAEWKGLIDSAELLFIRATGSTNRRTLYGPYEGQVLNSRDTRIRGFPFSTRRATQSELMRCFIELTRVKVTTIDEEALRKEEEAAAAVKAAKAEAATNGKPSSPKPAKRSKEEEEAALHTTQLQALIRRSKAPGVVSYIQNNSLTPDFRFFPAEQNHHATTPLHLASASNSPACISALLVKLGADPTSLNGDGKTAFEIAGDRATRDAFRLARSQLGEDRWNWEVSHIPTALSQAEVDKRTEREKVSADAEASAEKDRRKAEMERIRKEDAEKQVAAREKKVGKGNVLGATPLMTAQERRMDDARGMSDEMRMRLERERRARAAEERIKRMQQNR
ncbi:hypothetical protein K431DRAFT_228700 [Polychaeton citri CBS 116435]|uniref:VLRF1 domain-containing protein n=1 Tax=Polychaeton citri CBS 116435 TaxID=1314669 RepID=A0A9P4UN64_9PEZI|nr:hypothetical protein K431DRAFT_228700 [Polychaeton citri CBS 116435]